MSKGDKHKVKGDERTEEEEEEGEKKQTDKKGKLKKNWLVSGQFWLLLVQKDRQQTLLTHTET